MGYDMETRKATIWDSGDVRFSTTTRATIGTAVAQVLNHPEATANRYLYISSFELSQNEILASLEKCTPNGKWDLTHADSDEQIKEGREALAKGDFMKAGKLALAASYKGGLGTNFDKDETLANELLGLEPEDVDTVIAEIVNSTK